jgi:hypothetical protein
MNALNCIGGVSCGIAVDYMGICNFNGTLSNFVSLIYLPSLTYTDIEK